MFVQEEMQGTESDLCLRFHAADPEHPHTGSVVGRIVQQRGLADPGLTLNDDRAAAATTRVREQLINNRRLFRAPQQHPDEFAPSAPASPARKPAARSPALKRWKPHPRWPETAQNGH
jgi:hypothetical protein